MQGNPGLPGPNGPNRVVNSPQIPRIFTEPFVAIPCTVDKNDIYLNQMGSYYAISISQYALGNAYVPPILPGEPGSWDIHNIFAGKLGQNGEVEDIFNLSQRPVIFFIQNVGALPIQVNFSDNHSNSLVYFSFGVPPNETPSSFLMEPLSILVFQAIFTTNNIVRIYNSFMDNLDYNQLFRTFDQALTFGYLDISATISSATVGPSSFINILGVSTPSRLVLTDIAPYFCENNLVILSPDLVLLIDGRGISKDSIFLLLIVSALGASTEFQLEGLVPIKNYKGQPVPTNIGSFEAWYIVIKGTTVTAYDKHHYEFDPSDLKTTGIGLVPL
jgi:hypothetical protein